MMKLETHGLTFRVNGCPIIEDVSFSLAQGEMVGLIGPNGAGKSTLLRTIIGLHDPNSGSVSIDGHLLKHMSNSARARYLAYLPQERNVEWGLSGRAVVMLGRYPYHKAFGGPTESCRIAVEKAIREVGAEGIANRSFSVMSGGERAQILLARVLCLEAPLLIADEPIAALDPHHQLQVMKLLKNAARSGAGVLVVMHDLTLASRFMDRLILMDKGKIVENGAPEKVLNSKNMETVYRISVIRAENDGQKVIVPWEDLPDREAEPECITDTKGR